MSEPGRLFDESDDELERLLIGTARAERSSARTRARTLGALGITGSAALAATAASVSAAPAALGKVSLTWAKLALGLSALGTIAALPPAYRAWQRHEATLAARAVTHAPAPAPALAALAAPAPTPTEEAAPAQAPADSRRASANLSRELAALDAARRALAQRQPARALAGLDAYALAFPRPRLGLEAEILRIDALARSGRRAQARDHAAAFLHQHPNSVLAARAQRYLRD